MKVKLNKPLRHKGKDLLELDIPLEALTGRALIEVEQELFNAGRVSLFPEYSKGYLIRVAARAARIPAEALEQLSAPDFTNVTLRVRDFLTASGSSGEGSSEEEPTEGIPEPAPEISSGG